MKEIISKELLGEVFTGNQQEFKVRSFDEHNLYYSWLDETPFGEGDCNCKWVDFEINIYELAHKCKEWAVQKNYELKSMTCILNEGSCWIMDWTDGDPYPNYSCSFGAPSEVQAIFKACQWILDNKEQQ